MTLKRLKRTLIISGCYVVILALLLSVSLTLTRYQDSRSAYASFGAASFNTLILGENTVAAMTDPTNPVVNKFGVNLQLSDFKPGMQWNENPDNSTAGTVPFSIANGTTNADFSQATVEYTLRLRTAGMLPLQYKLALWTDVSAEPGGGHYTYYPAGTPAIVDSDAHDLGTWYEYTFHPDGASAEALFEIKGGALRLNAYKLIMEWPIVTGVSGSRDTNSTDYMKEVELIEILVDVSSKNMLSVDGYEHTVTPSGNIYSTGIIVLDPLKGTVTGTGKQYSHMIDYRAFSQDGVSARSFTFNVDNGIGKAATQTDKNITYSMLLKMPVNGYTGAYNYTLYPGSSTSGTALTTPIEYRLYNEAEGTYVVCETADYPTDKSMPEYRMYAIYGLASAQTLVNSVESGGEQVPVMDADIYKLSIARPDSSPIADSELESISFDNKLEILLEAEFTND